MRTLVLVLIALIVVLVPVAILAPYWTKPEDVVLYCSVDQDQSLALKEAFEGETGLTVLFQGETEAHRSIGLPQRLLTERDNPRADVFWSNEIMNMIHLSRMGILDPLPEGLAAQFDERWRDPQGRYVAFGARARVLLVNTELLPDPADHPTSVEDLFAPAWAERGLLTCMARPLTGTTYTHAVVLLTRGEAAGRAFLESVARAAEAGRLRLAPSNGQAMDLTTKSENKIAFCLTDTDDAHAAISRGAPVRVVYPDQAEGRPGTLLIPNTAALVKGRPHPETAERLLRWLLSEDVEARLAKGPSAQIPLRPKVSRPDHVRMPERTMAVDWQVVGENRDRWQDWLTRVFRPAE